MNIPFYPMIHVYLIYSGRFFIDEEVLYAQSIWDLSNYACDPRNAESLAPGILPSHIGSKCFVMICACRSICGCQKSI